LYRPVLKDKKSIVRLNFESFLPNMDYIFFYGQGNGDHQLGTDRFFHTQEKKSGVH
jgi:hypothetical protein